MHAARTVALLALGLVTGGPLRAQHPPDRNLRTCLSGKHPALCNYGRLTPDELRRVRAAELRENLRVCMTGKYPVLCNHSKLTPDEATQVREAERVENLRICSSGKYPALCRHDLLTPGELTQVRIAERAENLRVCMDGRYPTLCSRSLLSPEQAKAAAAAEARVPPARSPGSPRAAQRRIGGGNCESGHWIDAVEGDGKIIKLEDGSLWEVSDVDTVTTSIWLPISDVILCDRTIINTDDGESAEVTPLAAVPRGRTGPATGPGYVIEASANDESFVINGEVFEAKTYCFGFERGDRVRFLTGSPLGACVSATILNVRSGKTCELWCE